MTTPTSSPGLENHTATAPAPRAPAQGLPGAPGAALGTGELWRNFLPMVSTHLMISLTHVLINGAVARLPSPDAGLAGLNVAKAVILVPESPALVVRSTVVALASDRQRYAAVRQAMGTALAFLVAVSAVIALVPPVGALVFGTLMGLSGPTLAHARTAAVALLALPLISGFRGMWQGVAIRQRVARVMPVATSLRVLALLVAIPLLLRVAQRMPLNGGAVGGALLAAGMALEAVTVWVLVRWTTRRHPPLPPPPPGQPPLHRSEILRFFTPVALSYVVVGMPEVFVNAALSRSASPEVNVASFALAWWLFIFLIGTAWSVHPACVALPLSAGAPAEQAIRRFTLQVAGLLGAAAVVLGLTPVGPWILRVPLQAPPETLAPASLALVALAPLPPLNVLRERYWAFWMRRGRTVPIAVAKGTGLAVMVGGLWILVGAFPGAGAAAAASAAVVAAEAVEAGLLSIWAAVWRRQAASAALNRAA